MGFLTRLFRPREVKSLLALIVECEPMFPQMGYRFVSTIVAMKVVQHQSDMAKLLRRVEPRGWLMAALANCAGDLLESGELHVHRAVLSPDGLEVRRVFEIAGAELVKLGKITQEQFDRNMVALQTNINEAV